MLKPKAVTLYRPIWQKIKDNGYDVIPLAEGKAHPFKGWPELPNGPEDIARWNGRAAAVRMFGSNLLVIDADTRMPIARDAVLGVIEDGWPEFYRKCLWRHSGGVKVALIGRTKTDRRTMQSRSWYPEPGVIDKERKNQVEVFTGNSRKYVGVHGMHSEGREYGYDGPSITDTREDELPWFPGDELSGMVDACDAAMERCGLHASRADASRGSDTVVYDLTPEMVFRLKDGTELTLAALEREVEQYGRQEGYGTVFDPKADTNDRVKANISATGLALWDTKTETSHRWAARKPVTPEQLAEAMKAIPAVVHTPGASAPERPGEKATLREQAAWLLATHAYCAGNDTVVELDEPSDGCQMKVVAFQRLFRSWYEETEGPKGGKNRDYATGWWELAETRINVRGVRMRPDMPFPVYAEAGAIYKNTYLRPRHEGSGDIAPWLAFMEHLLPARDEREWFCNWLAHKHLHPGVPGVAVVMVAVDARGPVYGAGRGILRDVIARLLGPKYVRPIDFDVFTGSSAQGIYTDWGAYATVITVNEAKDTADSGHWANRRAVYERLKELVDPRAIERTFQPKGQPAFSAQAFASYLIFSNNRDALQIPPDDRRAAALSNGGRMAGAMAAGLQAWMEDGGNIAELARWLEARDLTGFDVYTPLHTAAKATMQALARSELDEAFDLVRKTIGPRGLFTGEALQAALVSEISDRSEGVLRSIKRMIRNAACKASDIARMTPAQGRAWILTWRGADVSQYADTVAMQLAAEHTERRLSETHGRGQGVFGGLPRTP
jgi:hypothetical protein